MARLPGEDWLIQQMDGMVVLYHRDTQREIVKFDPSDPNACAKAQEVIAMDDRLNMEQKAFAHFWSGYFYAHATK